MMAETLPDVTLITPYMEAQLSPQAVECCKRQLNQGIFVLLYFRLFTFSDLY